MIKFDKFNLIVDATSQHGAYPAGETDLILEIEKNINLNYGAFMGDVSGQFDWAWFRTTGAEIVQTAMQMNDADKFHRVLIDVCPLGVGDVPPLVITVTHSDVYYPQGV